jgi:T5SS/PEP-CTERM-associated repeat protein
VGNGGAGTLIIENHGKVHNRDAYVGYGSSGTVSVDGPLSEWQLSGNVHIGDSLGSGVLSVTNYGLIGAPKVIVGINGEIHGDGIIEARIENSGIVSPGPGVSSGVSVALQIRGPFAQGAAGKLIMELASATSYDRLNLASVYGGSLAGTLTVKLINGFVPQPGDDFDLLSAYAIVGTFDTLQLPALTGNLEWQVLYQTNGVKLVVVLPGDYNFNGIVDAADYVVWRKNDGSPAGYNAWRMHFGQTAGSGSGAIANAAIPEPSTLATLLVGMLAAYVRRRTLVS